MTLNSQNSRKFRPAKFLLYTVVKIQFMIMSHSGIDLDGNTVGRAFTRTMCSDSNSIGITEDGGGSVEFVGSTAAHELGHIFNMDHDSSPSE